MSYGLLLAQYHISDMPVHERTASSDSRMCYTFHVFHAFTWFDIVSSFEERQEKSLTVVPKPTGAFDDLLLLQDGISDQTMSTLERFTWCLS